MYDYSEDNEEKEKFILGYTFTADDITVNLASKRKYYVPNNKENILKLNKKMEKQVKCAHVRIMPYYKYAFASSFLLLITSFINIIYSKNFFCIILCIISAMVLLFSIYEYYLYVCKKIHLNKHIYFLENKAFINENLKICNKMFLNLSISTTRIIKDAIEENKKSSKGKLTINNINTLSIKELRIIKDNITNYIEFEFDENNENLKKLNKK